MLSPSITVNPFLQQSLQTSFVYCIYCFILHLTVLLFSPVLIHGFSKIMTNPDKYSWFNRGVSIIHASTVFILACWYWRVLNPSLIVNGHLTISEFQAFTLDVMMGYLWYDIIIELSTTRQADTIGHHVLGLISHLSCRITNNEAGAFYSMMVYIAEGSTPALHICWLLHKLNLKNSIIFKFFVAWLLLGFFFCRILVSPYMLWHMSLNVDAWGQGNELLFYLNFSIVFLFAVLNFYWFYKLISLALK